MSQTENRGGLISAIKSPLGITALIILVAEAITVLAMTTTPKSDPFFKWYYIIMIGLLALLIPAYYLYIVKTKGGDEKSETQTVTVDNKTIQANPATSDTNIAVKTNEDVFTDSNYGFALIVSNDFKRSEYLDYFQFLDQKGLLSSPNDTQSIRNNLEVAQFGQLLLNSSSLTFQYGNPTEIYFTKNTTTDPIEIHLKRIIAQYGKDGTILTEEQIEKLRHQLNFGELAIEKIAFTQSFSITMMPKKFSNGYGMAANISNVFLVLLLSNPQPMDSLLANNQSIIWHSTTKISNVKVEEKETDLLIYRIERLIESENYFFLLTIQWSPNLVSSVDVWNKLQKMFESFHILTKKNQQ